MARSTVTPPTRIVPTQVQQGPVGSANPAAVTGRSIPLTAIASRGPSQRRERFGGLGIPANIARGMNAQQDAIAAALGVLQALPWANGLSITQGVSWSAGQQKSIAHNLGRAPRGYMVSSVAGGGYGLFQRITNAQTDPFTITIQSANTCTGDVWVW